MKTRWSLVLLCMAALPLLGCASARMGGLLDTTGGNAALYRQFQAYDGRTAQPISFDEVVARAAAADAVLFGEEHSNVVCNALEAQLLAALVQRGRPVTLAMEFFEADRQPPLDGYLAGNLPEPEFREKTGQKNAYLLAHRPLIELCKAAEVPVVAANAPRRYLGALRKSGKTYADFLAGLPPAERSLLPSSSTAPRNRYWEDFCKVMASHDESGSPASQPASGPSSAPSSAPAPATQPDAITKEEKLYRGYMAQCLWDDAMSESVAKHRAAHPGRRVLLVIGSFHIAHDGGTAAKLRARRPDDRICTVVYRGTANTGLPFDVDDRDARDVVIYGVTPEEKK